MSLKYAVLGAGRQGVAAAYDLARLGDAKEVRLYDLDADTAMQGAEKVNKLLQTQIVNGQALDVGNPSALVPALRGMHSAISAVPYTFNLTITEAAIEAHSNICDLGGHTETVRKQLALSEQAKAAGITITPDCGMGPGLNINMGIRAMDYLDEPEDVYIWDGGLPQNPQEPWNYFLTFNINGLINEYYGDAWFLRGGQPTQVPCLTEIETLDFPQPLGMLEAAVTSGGLSTAPWTFQDKIRRLENKTLRYPGHWDQFKAFQSLGLFDLEERKINGPHVCAAGTAELFTGPKNYSGATGLRCLPHPRPGGRTAERFALLLHPRLPGDLRHQNRFHRYGATHRLARIHHRHHRRPKQAAQGGCAGGTGAQRKNV